MREAVEWCGGTAQLSVREAARLRQATAPPHGGTTNVAHAADDTDAADVPRRTLRGRHLTSTSVP